MSTADRAAPPTARPTLRGVSHQLAAFAWPILGFLLFDGLEPPARIATAVYIASATALFTISALYHRVTWTPAARQRMRRLDHAAIFLLIAGTYTPICVVGMGLDVGLVPLVVVWVGAALGVAKAVFWVHAPKWVIAALGIAVGWAPMIEYSALLSAIDAVGAGLFLGGGALYTLGAVIYARKRPDPWPATFGYHEVFHLLVVVAAALHLMLILRITGVTPVG